MHAALMPDPDTVSTGTRYVALGNSFAAGPGVRRRAPGSPRPSFRRTGRQLPEPSRPRSRSGAASRPAGCRRSRALRLSPAGASSCRRPRRAPPTMPGRPSRGHAWCRRPVRGPLHRGRRGHQHQSSDGCLACAERSRWNVAASCWAPGEA